MSDVPTFGVLESDGSAPEAPKSDTPFRIAVLGDFSGRANRGEADPGDLAGRKLLKVDRANFDDAVASLAPALRLPLDDGQTAELRFASLDDFHPDQVFDKVERFQDLYDSDERSALMNALLHHPAFQALESAWRGLDWLLRRVKEDETVQVVLVDVTFDELAADLNASEDLSACGLYRVLIEKATQGPKGQPWAVLVGLYLFEPTPAHVGVLGRLARIARQASTPFLAAAPARVFDKTFVIPEAAAPAWEALRQLPEAALVGLAAPGFLLRLPFGDDTKSIDRFSYEEFSTRPGGKVYLWGNPALACAALLAQSYAQKGWGFKPGVVTELGSMPLHTYTQDDDTEVTLMEVWVTTQMSEKASRHGFMTLLPVKNRDTVQLARFQGLALAAKGLAGRWDQGAGVPRPVSSKRPPLTVSINPTAGPAPEAPPPPAPPPAAEEPAPEAPPEEVPAAADEFSAPPAEESVAPEAPMADLGGDVPAEPPAEEAPAEPAPEAAAEGEIDPEIAALLKQLEEQSGG